MHSSPQAILSFRDIDRQRKLGAKKADLLQTQNVACAGEILRAPDRFGGEGSLMVRWARLVMERCGA